MKLLAKKGFTLVELMVVIVIVGILAAVAIPKFTMASHKAKASEFPTVLTQIYTAEIAYEAESGSYTASWADLGVDNPTSQSRWFSYDVTSPAPGNAFTGTATVKAKFGDANVGDAATVNDSNIRGGATNLTKYAPNWKM